MKTIKPYFILFTVLLFSCEKEINFKFNNAPNKLVVFCFFTPDSVWKAQVFQLKNISLNTDTINFFQNNATVKIFENDTLIDVLINTNNGIYISSENLKPQEGKAYKIEVTCDNFTSVTSSYCVVPEKPDIQLLTYSENINYSVFKSIEVDMYFFDEGNFSSYKILIKNGTIVKILGKVNFLTFYSTFSDFSFNKYCVYQPYSNTLKMQNITDSIEFVLAHGNSIKCNDCEYSQIENEDSLTIKACNLSEEYLQFLISSDKQNREQLGVNNIFFSNTDVYTNLEGGIGIFASYSSFSTLKVKYNPPPEDFIYFFN